MLAQIVEKASDAELLLVVPCRTGHMTVLARHLRDRNARVPMNLCQGAGSAIALGSSDRATDPFQVMYSYEYRTIISTRHQQVRESRTSNSYRYEYVQTYCT